MIAKPKLVFLLGQVVVSRQSCCLIIQAVRERNEVRMVGHADAVSSALLEKGTRERKDI